MRRNSRRTTLCSSPPGIPEARFLTNGKLLARAFNPNRDTGPTILFRHRARAQSTIHFHPNEPDPLPRASEIVERISKIKISDACSLVGRSEIKESRGPTDASRRKQSIERSRDRGNGISFQRKYEFPFVSSPGGVEDFQHG